MAWFFNSHTGKLVHEDPPSPGFYVYEAALHSGTGWHELTVPDSATEAQAAAAAAAEFPGSPAANSENDSLGGAANAVTGTAGAAAGQLTGVAAIGDFFSRITQGNTWIRVGEVVAGLILLGIGLNAMLKGKPLQVVTGAAGKVGKVAML